jgi:thiol-disulfide isomerase/thioredoxin
MSGNKQVITHFENRNEFIKLLENNPGLVIIKFGATWCGPCKKIEKEVHNFFNYTSDNVICADVDVDESIDLYSFLKSKKMVNGIPVLLCYRKGNVTYIPDDSVTGADLTALGQFFQRCIHNSKLV